MRSRAISEISLVPVFVPLVSWSVFFHLYLLRLGTKFLVSCYPDSKVQPPWSTCSNAVCMFQTAHYDLFKHSHAAHSWIQAVLMDLNVMSWNQPAVDIIRYQFGSLLERQFCAMAIAWKYLVYLDVCQLRVLCGEWTGRWCHKLLHLARSPTR